MTPPFERFWSWVFDTAALAGALVGIVGMTVAVRTWAAWFSGCNELGWFVSGGLFYQLMLFWLRTAAWLRDERSDEVARYTLAADRRHKRNGENHGHVSSRDA